MKYVIIDTPTRISAEDESGVTIVGAQMPRGDVVWKLYMTDRLTADNFHRCHPVVCSREGARQWVEVIAELYVAAQSNRVLAEKGM